MFMTSLLVSCLMSANPEPVFRDHDRVVFLGDSITVLHTWTRLVELSVRLRHPEWSVTFINAGIGGNTVEDALERLDVDVLAHQPTVVFVNFGMNDASFPEGSSGAAFEKNMTTLLDRLAKAKVRRVVWLDTTPYDTSVGAGNAFNRRRVARITELVEFTKTLGAERELPVVPVNDAVTRAITAWKAGKRSENLMPDRIHPGPTLHGVMAAEVLSTVGFDVTPARVKVSVRDGAAFVEGRDAGVPLVDGRWELELSSVKAPLPFVASADAKLLDSKALLSLGALTVSLVGLPPKQRYLVFAHRGHAAGAARLAGWDHRLSALDCELAAGQPFERYPRFFDSRSPVHGAELWIPVIGRTAAPHIRPS